MNILLSFLLSSLLIIILTKKAKNLNLIDEPKGRKNHLSPVPIVGGLSISLTFFILFLFNYQYINHIIQVNEIIIIFFSSFIVVLLGLFDDIKEINTYKKIIVQLIAISIIVIGLELHSEYLFLFKNYYINIFCNISFIFIVINGFNFLDGLDGLVGLVSIIICLFFIILNQLFISNDLLNIFLYIIIGSLISFIYFNFKPAKIFLGDSGSLFIGLFFVIIMIYSIKLSQTTKLFFPIFMFISIPVFDAILVAIQRFNNRNSFLNKLQAMIKPDNIHLHHLLMDQNKSKAQTLIIICCMIICTSLFGILLIDNSVGFKSIYFILIFILLFIYRVYLQKKISKDSK